MSKKRRGEPTWSWRRSLIFPIIAFACWRLVALESAADTRLNETIAWGWMLVVVALVFVYTGFATVQDVIAIWRTRSATPYQDSSPPILAADAPQGEAWRPMGDTPP